jgi:hypothetical protein
MVKTVGQLRPVLARLTGTTGVANTSGVFLSYLNRALLELWHEGDWAGLCDRYKVPINDGQLYLPPEFESVSLVAVDGHPTPLRSRDWELHAYGAGVQSATRMSVATPSLVDSGVVSLRGQAPAGTSLRIVTTQTEEPSANIAIPVRLADGTSVLLSVSLAGVAASRDTLVEIDSIDLRAGLLTKTETIGVVEIRDADANLIDSIAPDIRVPQYRAYRLVGSDQTRGTVIATVRARRAFRELTGDEDIVPIAYTPALETMFLALRAKDNASVAEYIGTKAIAIEQLAKFNSTLEPRRDLGIQWEHAFGFEWEGV